MDLGVLHSFQCCTNFIKEYHDVTDAVAVASCDSHTLVYRDSHPKEIFHFQELVSYLKGCC